MPRKDWATYVPSLGLGGRPDRFGADGQTRTDDLSFTKALLYQLSYVGACNRIVAPGLSGPAGSQATRARHERSRIYPRANDTMASNCGW